jgi:exosome complex component RRP4
VAVPAVLIKRSKSHFHDFPCGVSVVLGLNGYIWVSKSVQKKPEDEENEYSYSDMNEVCCCLYC